MNTTSEMTNRVLIPKLNHLNYQQWKFAVEMVLNKEDLWDIVMEEPPDPTTPEWRKKDGGAKASIALSVEPHLYHIIKECSTSKLMWNKIKENFERVGLLSKVFIKRKLFGTKLNQFTNMELFLNSIIEQAGKLRMCGDNFTDLDIVSTILCGLPENYENLIMGLETRDESSLNLDYIQAILMDEFNRKEEKLVQAHALVSTERKPAQRYSNNSERRCYECRRIGHVRNNCPQLRSFSDQNYRMQPARRYTRNADHESSGSERRIIHDTVNSSSTLHDDVDGVGYDLNQDLKQKLSLSEPTESSEYYYAYVSLTNKLKQQPNGITNWIIDSGASRHMSGNKNNFSSYVPFEQHKEVIFANESTAKALGIGTVTITYGNHPDEKNFDLDQVLFVPDIGVNLLSVPILCLQQFRTIFDGTRCSVSLNDEQIFAGQLQDGIFALTAATDDIEKVFSACVHVWHRRLGHRHLESILDMNKSGKVKNLRIDKCTHDDFCPTCNKSKLKQTNYKRKVERTTDNPFTLLHTDICGPIKPTTRAGGNYFLTIVDDYSRYCYVRVIRQKSEAAAAIIEFITHAHNKFGYFPTALRSDGGGEFENNHLNEYLRSVGIEHQLCVPYAPQQNGVAERINRTLVEMLKSLLFEKKLPLNLWGEAVATAGYLYNRIVHSTTNETPFTLWEGRAPDLSHLRVMGSRVFALVPKPLRSKLEDNSTQGILLGYADRQKGFKILESISNKIIISNSIGFDEVSTREELQNTTTDQLTLEFPFTTDRKLDEPFDNNCTNKNVPRRSTRTNFGRVPVRYRMLDD